jgi:hypothetical protein
MAVRQHFGLVRTRSIIDKTLHWISMQTHQSNDESGTDTAAKDEFEAFEMALRTLSERVGTDDAVAHDLYGALCNMRWRRQDADAEPVSMSWRYAGGVVSHLACKGGCYLDYYCSGNEGVVPARIREALGELGWIPSPWPEKRRVSSTPRSAAETSASNPGVVYEDAESFKAALHAAHSE